MSRFAARLEVVSNVAIIVLAVIVAAIALRDYIFTPHMRVELPRGARLELSDVRRSERPQTLVVVLRKERRFCSASAPFYQRLLAQTERRRVPVIVARPDELEASHAYLRRLGISVSDVRHVLHALGVGATPTLVLTDSRGALARSRVWQSDHGVPRRLRVATRATTVRGHLQRLHAGVRLMRSS